MCQLHSKQEQGNQKSLSSVLLSGLPASFRKRTTRLKFWEMKSRYHCAALGTCLTLKELRIIAKKGGIDNVNQWDDYDMHISFVSNLSNKCRLSILVNKALDKKYALIVKKLSKAKNENERIEFWNKAVESGDIAGVFWAMLTHPHSTQETLFQIYGEVHMLSHLSGASIRVDMQTFYKLEKENKELVERMRIDTLDFNKKLHNRRLQLDNKKIQLSEAFERMHQLELDQQELRAIKKSPVVVELKKQLVLLQDKLENADISKQRAEKSENTWKQRALKEQQEKQHIQQQLTSLYEENSSVENTLISLLDKKQNTTDNCSSCLNNNPDLCGRCVLYIGGRNSQYSHFRKLVEQQNGKFIYHDGGREEGYQKLASIVVKADVVFCPLDCVSHTAMNLVKKHCNNNTKQLVYIPHASLSAFSRGLDEVNEYVAGRK